MTWTAIVPMRGGSVRVPGKNLRELAGKPLYTYILDSLIGSRKIGRIVVDSDDDQILEAVAKTHPSVSTMKRPANLGTGDTPMNLVLERCVGELAGDYFLQTHATNPLLTAQTVDDAISEFESQDSADSLFTVTALYKRLWSIDGLPLNHDPKVLLPTQDLEPVMEENSCLYLFSRTSLNECRNRIGNSPALMTIPALEALDIDTEEDWQVCEAMMQGKHQ